MVAFFDILVYVIFAFFASNIAKKSENYIKDNDIPSSHWDKYLTYFVLFFTIIGGIRWNVGSDCISYAMWLTHQPIDYESNEKLWTLLTYWFQRYKIHWTIGLGLCMFIQTYFVTKTLQPYRWLLVFMPFVFFGSYHWQNWVGAVRQMMVGCGFLWASRFIYEKQLVKYLLFIFIGSLVHQSALILLPFYLIPNWLNIVHKRWLLISILFTCVMLGQTAEFSGLAPYVQALADTTDYEGYADSMYEMLVSGYDDEALQLGPMMLTYLLIPLFIIWYGPELEEKYAKKIPYFNLWYTLSFFYSCAYFLVCNLGHIFIRPILYFSVFQLVLASLLLYHLCTEYKLHRSRQILTYFFCFVIALNSSWNVYKAVYSDNRFEAITYKIFLFHQDQLELFNL